MFSISAKRHSTKWPFGQMAFDQTAFGQMTFGQNDPEPWLPPPLSKRFSRNSSLRLDGPSFRRLKYCVETKLLSKFQLPLNLKWRFTNSLGEKRRTQISWMIIHHKAMKWINAKKHRIVLLWYLLRSVLNIMKFLPTTLKKLKHHGSQNGVPFLVP